MEDLPHLCAALKGRSKGVRLAAANALSRVWPGAKAVLPTLWPMLEDKDQAIRDAADAAIKRIDLKG